MIEERRKILEMLADGKINADEAERLLDAVEPSKDSAATSPVGSKIDGLPEYLYVMVEPKDGAEDADQVKVTIPLSLVKAGMNFMSLLPKNARKDVESALDQSGFDFDLEKLSGAEADAFLMALKELVVDVETKENTVKIYTG